MYAPETLITSNKLFQLWHVDPKGDSGPPCHDPGNWKWHISHWQFQRPIWMHQINHRFIRKCYICGHRGRTHNHVNLNDHKGYRHSNGCLTKPQSGSKGDK